MNWNEGSEKYIKTSLMLGNLQSAVDCCFKCGRHTEALVIALMAEKDVLDSTVHNYLNQSSDPFIKGVLTKLYDKDYSHI